MKNDIIEDRNEQLKEKIILARIDLIGENVFFNGFAIILHFIDGNRSAHMTNSLIIFIVLLTIIRYLWKISIIKKNAK